MAKKKVALTLPNDAKFIPRPGARLSKKKAAELGPLLVKLSNQYGGFTREMIFDLASDPKSPLHSVVFDCSQARAAEQHYLGNVNRLARAILLDFRDSATGEREQVQLFHWIKPRVVSVVTPDGEGADPEEEDAGGESSRYINYAQATEDPATLNFLLHRANADVSRFKRQYTILKRLAPTFKGKRRKLWNAIKRLF